MKRHASLFGSISILVLCLSVTLPVSAQTISGEITGTVTDQSQAAVPGATVAAVCPDTKQTRTVTSGGVGEYRLADMPACIYKVSVSSQGFKTTVRDVTVSVGQTTKSDFQLQIGQRTETITVEASTPLVDFAQGLNNEVDAKAIVDLPTEGRDFKSILGLTPGVQRSPGGGFLDVSVSGQRTTANNYLIDGMPNNDRFYGSEVVGQPGVLGIPASVLGGDSIAEYTVQQLPSAENGVKGGAAINVTLKSGTNDLHGTAFYFGDYDWLNAKNFFSAKTIPYHNHNYGATVGGPIVKNRTFYFANFEGQKNKSVLPYNVAIPTVGDLAAALGNLACKVGSTATCPIDPMTMLPIIINTGNLPVNPAGLALLKYYPCATSTPASGSFAPTVSCTPAAANAAVATGGFTQTIAAPNTDTLSSFIIKIDHKMNDKMQLSGRYLFADSLQSAPLGGYTLPPATGSGLGLDAFNSIAPTRVQLAGLTWTYNMSANKILDVRFNWSRYAQILDPNNKIDPLSLGIDTGPLNPADFGVPPVYASSVTYGNPGGIFGYPLSTRPTQTYDGSAHFTWIKGTHTMKMGGNYQYATTFSLRNRARSSLSSNQSDFPTFLSQLLVGRIDSAARSFGDTSRHLLQPALGLFWQDEWKLSKRITVSYGLRWEVNGALGDADLNASNFFPCAAPEPTYCSPKGFPNGLVREQVGFKRLYGLDLHDFGPRAGIAWDVFGNGKTSLRAGYSMTYDVANFAAISAPYSFKGARASAFTNPNLGVFSVSANGNFDPTLLYEAYTNNTCYNPTINTVPVGSKPDWICIGPQPGSGVPGTCLGAAVGCYPTYGPTPTANPPFNIFGTVSPLKTPRIQYFNATLQQEVFKNSVVTVSYIGARGSDYFLNRSLNNRPIGCWSSAINPASIQASNPNGDPYGQLTGGPMTANNPTPLNCNRPFDSVFQTNVNGTLVPSYNYVVQLTNGGWSHYNAMQAGFRQRNWHGFDTIVNFTWSHCTDTNSVSRGGSSTLPISENPYVSNANQGPCDNDVRLNFNSGVTYDFPKWSALGRFGEGWQIGGLYTGFTGRPWTPLISTFSYTYPIVNPPAPPAPQTFTRKLTGQDNSGQDQSYQRPDCIAAPQYQFTDFSKRTVTNRATAFRQPAVGTIGSCGRNSLRGPRFDQLDMNLNKTTKITERLRLQIRFEVFNVLNHPNVNPTPSGNSVTSGGFSKYSQTGDTASGNPYLSQGGARAMQIGLKLIF